MTESDDWRLRRAEQLGIEPFGQSLVRLRPVEPEQPRFSGPQRPENHIRDTYKSNEDVSPMRCPPPSEALAFDVRERRDPFARPSPDTDRPTTRPTINRERGVKPNVAKPSDVGPSLRASFYFVGTVVAAAIAAAGGAWFGIRQSGSLPPDREIPVQLAQAAPVAAPVPQPLRPVVDREAQPVPALPTVMGCAEPGFIDGLRDAAREQMRQSGLGTGRVAPVTVGITNARPKIAGADGSLMVCTAVLTLKRNNRRLAAIDVDYAVRTAAGSLPQVVPFAINHVFDRIVASEAASARQAAIDLAGSKRDAAAMVTAAVGRRSSRDAAAPTGAVVVSRSANAATGALGYSAPTSLGLGGTAAWQGADRDFAARPVTGKLPRGCEEAPTRSVSITCQSPYLLALNANIRSAIAAFDPSRDASVLARIKRSADRRFDRCTTASCVESAYYYWLEALARVERKNELQTAGTGAQTSYGDNSAPQPVR